MANFSLIWSPEGYDIVVASAPLEFLDLFRDRNGKPFGKLWPSPNVSIANKNCGKNLKKGDFLIGLLGHTLIFRRSVISSLGNILEAHGEILPLRVNGNEELFILNTRICNCLVEHGTDIPPSGRGVWHDWWEFDGNHTCCRDIIIIPEEPFRTFVSDAFIERVTQSRLTGIEFSSINRRAYQF